MQDAKATTLTHDEVVEAINLCLQAYLDVKAKLSKNAGWSATNDNHEAASQAFLAKLPVLYDPQSFQLYIACIAKGASIGVIDPVDIGRYCHVAQIAISAWKLTNLTIPEAQRREKEAAEKGEKKATLPPPNGNQESVLGSLDLDKALRQALDSLPSFEEQKKYFLLLRGRGHLLPSDPELRDNPLAAIHFVRLAEQLLRQDALADIPRRPEPGQEPATDKPEQRSQAA